MGARWKKESNPVQGDGRAQPGAQALVPQARPLAGQPHRLGQRGAVHLAAGDPLGGLRELPQLVGDVGQEVRPGFAVDEGGVDDHQRHAEMGGQRPVPVQDGLADVGAAAQEIGPGQAPDGGLAGGDAPEVGPGVAAQVAGVPLALHRFGQLGDHALHRADRAVVLRVDRVEPERAKHLHREAAGDPGDRHRAVGEAAGEVVEGRQLLELARRLERRSERPLRASAPAPAQAAPPPFHRHERRAERARHDLVPDPTGDHGAFLPAPTISTNASRRVTTWPESEFSSSPSR